MCVHVCAHVCVHVLYMCMYVCMHAIHTPVNCMLISSFQTNIVERFLWVGTGECEDYL